jgi:hypothetical protein
MASSVFARNTSLAWLVRWSGGAYLYVRPIRRPPPDTEDRDGRVFNNKAERVKQELWVSAKYIAFIVHS